MSSIDFCISLSVQLGNAPTSSRGKTASWQAYSEADNLHLYVAYVDGAPAGYFELQQQEDGNVEIMYFGLSTALYWSRVWRLSHSTQAIEHASGTSPDTRRVWVHTCSLDHPQCIAKLFKPAGLLCLEPILRLNQHNNVQVYSVNDFGLRLHAVA
ncbi:hypothetical protein PEC18_35405 [Paucibacter sp. O1-1]|nr:hypothetical protein [Paucibacter sp. O1-1]MDA3830954.1 hypothetical protein [Paucibacter sp. O1-1]